MTFLSVQESSPLWWFSPATSIGDDQGGLCLSQTRRTSGGSLAIPTGVIFPSLISFQDPRYVILRPVGPLSPRRIPYHHLSSSKRLYHPSIQPKHRASSRAWQDGNLSFFGGRL